MLIPIPTNTNATNTNIYQYQYLEYDIGIVTSLVEECKGWR